MKQGALHNQGHRVPRWVQRKDDDRTQKEQDRCAIARGTPPRVGSGSSYRRGIALAWNRVCQGGQAFHLSLDPAPLSATSRIHPVDAPHSFVVVPDFVEVACDG
jgi:hypothetical protein